ncbi:DNA-directed RNA polymerase subunit beta [Vaginisenegalia massiliensis]|uniref:DNA-directed RNA polymerase subunit beta n=1 Tax=Vaginisenegalia massiliensis TaxID=2058294 RepID=UPI000F53F2A0|nr:DNA-directed RNA polymerase subunit beta [Vaginisenegalia massiliensis]
MSDSVYRESFTQKINNFLLRTIIFILILFLCFIVGLFIGYVLIGKGPFWEVLNIDTWKHIIDFIK